MPSGMSHATFAISAISWIVLCSSGEPFTKNLPSSYSMSAASASSRWAASVLALSLILRLAMAIAAPETAVVRLPYVPQPIGVLSVSPWITSTSSTGTPSSPREYLGEGRLLPLAVRRGADHHVYLAGRMESHDRALPQAALEANRSRDLRWAESAYLHVGADADADVLAFRPHRCLFLSRRSAYPMWSTALSSAAS